MQRVKGYESDSVNWKPFPNLAVRRMDNGWMHRGQRTIPGPESRDIRPGSARGIK
jgi:hypothetical protein